MKLFKLYFGQPIKINLNMVDEQTKNTIKSLFKMMNESIDLTNDKLPMVAMHPCKKGYEVAPSKGMGAMGHRVEVPRKAIVVSEPAEISIAPEFDVVKDMPLPKSGFGMKFDNEIENSNNDKIESEDDKLILGKEESIDDNEYEKEVFKKRIDNILQKLSSWETKPNSDESKGE